MSAAILGGIAGGAFSMYSQVQADKAAAEEASRKRAEEILSAKRMYSSVESSSNIMKSVAREQSANAINEALRAGAAQDRQVKQEINKVASKQIAQSEGLTSGRSKGRAMISTYIQGNQALAQSKTQTASMVNQITDAKDKIQNDMNNRLLQAHQEMAAVLTTPTNVFQADWTNTIAAGLSGFQQGASMGSSMGSMGASTPTASPIQGPVRSDGFL
jgi:hypothetical protein